MLKSDEELVKESNCTLEVIRAKAALVLTPLVSANESTQPTKTKSKKRKKPQTSNSNCSVSKTLFEAYHNTEDLLTKSVLCYLLKNSCKISEKEQEPDKFAKRRRKTEIKIERLIEQLESRIPKGRDLTGDKWLETLAICCKQQRFAIASTTAPTNSAEAKSWQDRLLTDSKSVPFPVAYETNEDLTWSKNSKGRFNGLGEHTFQLYCDQRQIKWFQRFYEDQEIKRASKDQHSSSLFTLRSGRLAWTEGTGKGDPWNIHHLNYQRQQKRSSSHQRHKAQKKAAANQFGESELGQYLLRSLTRTSHYQIRSNLPSRQHCLTQTGQYARASPE